MINAFPIALFFLCGGFSCICDIKSGSVPRYLLWISTILSLVYQYIFIRGNFIFAVLGCIVGLFVFFLVKIISGGKLGLGDIWFSSFSGSTFGIWLWFPATLISCLIAFVFMLPDIKRKIPFTPFLFTGSCLIFIYSFFIN